MVSTASVSGSIQPLCARLRRTWVQSPQRSLSSACANPAGWACSSARTSAPALPTATDELLGADQWGAGPTGVALKQAGPWTYGALANHIWSFAGDSDRNDINNTFLQPFVTFTTPTAWSFALQAEATYDWQAEQWNVPVGLFVSKVVRLGKQMISLQAGPRYYVESTPNGPEGWAFRANVTLLFPK